MDLRETKIAREYLGTAVFRLKAKVEQIAGAPGVDHQPPVTAVRWEKLSGPEMNAITQLLNGARFLINHGTTSLYCENEMVHGKKGGDA